MDTRDPELDELLEPLRGIRPTASERQRWQAAVAAAATPKPRFAPTWQLMAACLIGAVVGLVASWQTARTRACEKPLPQQMANENRAADATIEQTYVKLD